MKLKKLLISILAIAMVFSLCAVPAMADTPAAAGNVIFIRDGAEGDGSSADSPLKPTTGNYDATAERPELHKDAALYQAWQKLMAAGGGTIVICGPYTLDNSNCQPIGGASADFKMGAVNHNPNITITYTSVWDGVDYRKTAGAELIMAGKSHLTFPTATIMENITVRATADNGDHYIAAGLNSLTLSKGTNFIPYDETKVDSYPMILGSFRSNAGALKEGDSNIVIDIGDENSIGNIFGMCNGGNGKHTGNTNITIKSGSVGGIYGDSRATGQVPLQGDINLNFEGGIYRGLIAGVNIGFSGGCDKVVNIKISGGDFSKCLGILPNTTAADALMPAAVNVDCSGAPIETARQVKDVASILVNLTLPENYTDKDPEPTNTDSTEPVESTPSETKPVETTPGETKPAVTDPDTQNGTPVWIPIVIAAAVAAVAAVAVIVVKKKK